MGLSVFLVFLFLKLCCAIEVSTEPIAPRSFMQEYGVTDDASSNTTDLMGEHRNVIIYTIYSSSAVGAIGSLLIIVVYMFSRGKQNIGTSLIFCLSIGDFMHAISQGVIPIGLHDDDNGSALCKFQAFFVSFSSVVSVMWSLWIGVTVFYALFFESYSVNKLLPFFHVVAWGYAFIAALIPLLLGEYKLMVPTITQIGCYLPDPKIATRLLIYFPTFMVFVILSFITTIIFFKVNNAMVEFRSYVRIMGLYMIAYTIATVPALVYRIQAFIDPKYPSWILHVALLTSYPLQGFLDCLVFGLTEPSFKEFFVDVYKNIRHKCKGKKSKYQALSSDFPPLDEPILQIDYGDSDDESHSTEP